MDKRLLIYVIVRDTGKAPNINKSLCTLSECKKRTIVKSARIGDWIIGMGGKGLSTGEYYKKMIYAMRVESENPPKSSYFTYHGDTAISISGFKKIEEVKCQTVKYINNPHIYRRFDEFMATQPRGKIGSYCTLEPSEKDCTQCKPTLWANS